MGYVLKAVLSSAQHPEYGQINPTHQPIYCRFVYKKIINSPGYSGRSVR